MVVEIRLVGGNLVIKGPERLTFDLRQARLRAVKEKILPKDVNLSVFLPLLPNAFPELNLRGVDEFGYMAEQSPGVGDEVRRQMARKLMHAGFSATKVSGIIINGNQSLKAAFHLGNAEKVDIENYINRFSAEIVKFYPHAGKKK